MQQNWQSYNKIKANLCNKWQTNSTLDMQEKKLKRKVVFLLDLPMRALKNQEKERKCEYKKGSEALI
jgi:hypothetical protein